MERTLRCSLLDLGLIRLGGWLPRHMLDGSFEVVRDDELLLRVGVELGRELLSEDGLLRELGPELRRPRGRGEFGLRSEFRAALLMHKRHRLDEQRVPWLHPSEVPFER